MSTLYTIVMSILLWGGWVAQVAAITAECNEVSDVAQSSVVPSIEQIETVMRSAGDILKGFFSSDAYIIFQKPDTTVVTEADHKSEEVLKNGLMALMPAVGFLGEETGVTDAHHDYQWIVDPLDGTSNFSHGNPYFAMSVALTYQGEPIIGAIYRPMTGEFYWAQTGRGAFYKVHGYVAPIRVMNRGIGFSRLHVGIGGPHSGKPAVDYKQLVQKIYDTIPSFRKDGSAALTLINVATGVYDAAFLGALGWWDAAAGILIIKEAGGVARELSGNEVREGYANCIVGHADVVAQVCDLLSR